MSTFYAFNQLDLLAIRCEMFSEALDQRYDDVVRELCLGQQRPNTPRQGRRILPLSLCTSRWNSRLWGLLGRCEELADCDRMKMGGTGDSLVSTLIVDRDWVEEVFVQMAASFSLGA